MYRGNGESPFCLSISGSSHMQDWVSSKCCHLVCEMHFVPFQFQGGRNGLIVVTELLYFFHMPLFQDSSEQAVAPYRDRYTRIGAREACWSSSVYDCFLHPSVFWNMSYMQIAWCLLLSGIATQRNIWILNKFFHNRSGRKSRLSILNLLLAPKKLKA